jgi:hypothetical protein
MDIVTSIVINTFSEANKTKKKRKNPSFRKSVQMSVFNESKAIDDKILDDREQEKEIKESYFQDTSKVSLDHPNQSKPDRFGWNIYQQSIGIADEAKHQSDGEEDREITKLEKSLHLKDSLKSLYHEETKKSHSQYPERFYDKEINEILEDEEQVHKEVKFLRNEKMEQLMKETEVEDVKMPEKEPNLQKIDKIEQVVQDTKEKVAEDGMKIVFKDIPKVTPSISKSNPPNKKKIKRKEKKTKTKPDLRFGEKLKTYTNSKNPFMK